MVEYLHIQMKMMYVDYQSNLTYPRGAIVLFIDHRHKS